MLSKDKICAAVRSYTDEMFQIACDIFDRPELAVKEFYACERLEGYLERQGFTLERGIAGLETAFRATYQKGEGGPVIGFMLEYDALPGLGHACGHHLQGPACIGAAMAIRDLCEGPYTLVLYGTPGEEGYSGKIDMVAAGCFTEADIVFCYHSGIASGVGYANKALTRLDVEFHGVAAHAAAHPYLGRSAQDGMMLMFHGLEFMREHIKDGCRIHYSVSEGTGPSNIIHENAKANMILRSPERKYLENMVERTKKIVEGACLMTETTADIKRGRTTYNVITPKTLLNILFENQKELECEKLWTDRSTSGGSSDVGNVSHVVPVANVYTFFCEGAGHSQVWVDDGKKPIARRSMENASEVIAMTALQLIASPELLRKINEEHRIMVEAEAE